MKRHSLLFGIQDYPGTGSLTPLKCPHADVDALAEVFGNPRYMGEVGQVVVSKDATFPEAQRVFRDFLKGVDRDDIALIHFSGHGMRDDEGDLYLCFSDATEDELHFTALNVKQLGNWLERQRLSRTLVTLDCCYSGAAGEQMTRSSVSAPLRQAERVEPDGTGLYILSSAGATETAKEANGRGVFSHHLVEGIRTGAADSNADGEITVWEIADYLSRMVPKDAAQKPFIRDYKGSGTFLVARNPILLEAAALREAEEEAAAAARKAEEEAAATEAARKATLAAALKKLKEHVRFGSFGMAFGGEVETWILHQRKSKEPGPQFGLVESFATGGLSAVEFHDAWRNLEHAESAAAEVAERQKAAEEQAAPERSEAAERERAEQERAEGERAEQERQEQERKAREKAAEERVAREKAEREKKQAAAREEAERAKAAEEQAARDKAARERQALEWATRLQDEVEKEAKAAAVLTAVGGQTVVRVTPADTGEGSKGESIGERADRELAERLAARESRERELQAKAESGTEANLAIDPNRAWLPVFYAIAFFLAFIIIVAAFQ